MPGGVGADGELLPGLAEGFGWLCASLWDGSARVVDVARVAGVRPESLVALMSGDPVLVADVPAEDVRALWAVVKPWGDLLRAAGKR